jgi:hypothetical protein
VHLSTNNGFYSLFALIICGAANYLMMLIAGSKYFPTNLNTYEEPPSIWLIGKYIEDIADFIAGMVNDIEWKALCLGMTKYVVGLPLAMALSTVTLSIVPLLLSPILLLQGLAYYVGYKIADKFDNQKRGMVAELLNGLVIGGYIWLSI